MRERAGFTPPWKSALRRMEKRVQCQKHNAHLTNKDWEQTEPAKNNQSDVLLKFF